VAQTAPARLAMIMTICHVHTAPAGRAPSRVRLSVSVNVRVCMCATRRETEAVSAAGQGRGGWHYTAHWLTWSISPETTANGLTQWQRHIQADKHDCGAPVAFLCHSDEHIVPL